MKDKFSLKRYDENNQKGGVLVIYTGGTIGSRPKDKEDSGSPQIVIDWSEFRESTPELGDLGFNVDGYTTDPLDSCNVGPQEWSEMAKVIQHSYDDYEGFVILHGTDTMVNTASALSFMLRNLGKPVILTGAQISYLWNIRNDGRQNMITALQLANPKHTQIPVIAEVCIYFHGKLFRGNRTKKLHASGFNAYDSPNLAPLATIGEDFEINTSLLRTPPQTRVSMQTNLESNVIAIDFFPGIQDGIILERLLSDTKLKGVVLKAYGAGNIPTKKEVLAKIKKAVENGVVFLTVTQCGGGKVELGLYETSAKLLDIGVYSGVDITSEAALAKLMVLLGDEDKKLEDVYEEIQRDLAGEQSHSIYISKFEDENILLDSNSPRRRLMGERINGINRLKEAKAGRVILRFRSGIVIPSEGSEYGNFQIYLNLGSEEEASPKSSKYLGAFKKLQNDKASMVFFDITEKAKNMIDAEGMTSFTLIMEGDTGSFSAISAEVMVYA